MDRTQAIIKLAALHNNVGTLVGQRVYTFDATTTQDLFERFEAILTDLQGSDPDLLGDVPVREMPKIRYTSPSRGSWEEYIQRADVQTLWNDIRYCLDVLRAAAAAGPASVEVTREGVFLGGQRFDALHRVINLIEQAGSEIDIIDGYVSRDVLALLTAKQAPVAVKILTMSVEPDLRVEAVAFNKQYRGLQIRTSGAFHDRFVVIDDTDFYHFGASLKDVGNRGFMFSRIEEPGVIDAFRTGFQQAWNQAKVVQI